MIATAESVLREQHCEPAFLARIRLRTQRRVLWMNHFWSSFSMDAARGLAITAAEVEHHLTSPEEQAAAEQSFYLNDAEARQISEQICEVDQQALEDISWEQLRRQFDLSQTEIDLLSLIVAPDFNPSLRRVYGYLHDDANLRYATQWLAARLFGWPETTRVGVNSNLLKWRLAFPLEGFGNPWAMNVPWDADPLVTAWLSSGVAFDAGLNAVVESAPLAGQSKTVLYAEHLAAMQLFVRAMRAANLSSSTATDGNSIVIEIIGPPGSGKRVLAAQLCATFGSDLLVADGSGLANADASAARDTIIRVARLARLKGATTYWTNTDDVNTKRWNISSGYGDLIIFGRESPLARSVQDNAPHMVVRLPRLTRSSRLKLWESLTGEPPPTPVSEWMLNPAEIVQAALVISAGPETVIDTCRRMLYQAPEELFVPLVCPYKWDDIVLTSAVRGHLGELEEQARFRRVVYEDWGFAKLCPLGQGITALFAGPSGTGKTMAAQVLARSLNLELYRVDLAGVVNKYIGETEKRLKRVFDSCERANVLLLFDEADALFGQRTQVKDAHDRFANIEIDYLLQRMEQFDGLAILATNRKNDIDKAFLRRLRFLVDFMEPGPVERLALWHLALLEQTPDGQPLLDQIDWEFLANKLTMTGADIKATALSAAFLARSEGSRIGMRHVLQAAGREMTKHGVVLRHGDLS